MSSLTCIHLASNRYENGGGGSQPAAAEGKSSDRTVGQTLTITLAMLSSSLGCCLTRIKADRIESLLRDGKKAPAFAALFQGQPGSLVSLKVSSWVQS